MSDDRILENATSELLQNLRQLGWVFEKVDGREGAKLACHAVAHFIYKIGGSPEMAIHLMAIEKGFEDLQRGVAPPLFSLDPQPSERNRSLERKWNQKWAAAILDFCVNSGELEKDSAKRIARAANDWSGFKTQRVTFHTVMNWRKLFVGTLPEDRKEFDLLREALKADPNAKGVIESVLQFGPRGMPKS